MYDLLSSDQCWHSRLVLEIYLYILADIAAKVNLDEGGMLEFRVHLDHALFLLMAYLGVEIASLWAIMDLFALRAKLMHLGHFTAMSALHQH